MTGQLNNSRGRGHDRLPNWNPKNGGMLISQPISRCLTNLSELCMSRLLNNQPRRISIYRLQRRPSFGFESLVSSTSMTSGDPVVRLCTFWRNSGKECQLSKTDSGGTISQLDAVLTSHNTVVQWRITDVNNDVFSSVFLACKQRL